LLVTHDDNVASCAQREILLRDGQLVSDQSRNANLVEGAL